MERIIKLSKYRRNNTDETEKIRLAEDEYWDWLKSEDEKEEQAKIQNEIKQFDNENSHESFNRAEVPTEPTEDDVTDIAELSSDYNEAQVTIAEPSLEDKRAQAEIGNEFEGFEERLKELEPRIEKNQGAYGILLERTAKIRWLIFPLDERIGEQPAQGSNYDDFLHAPFSDEEEALIRIMEDGVKATARARAILREGVETDEGVIETNLAHNLIPERRIKEYYDDYAKAREAEEKIEELRRLLEARAKKYGVYEAVYDKDNLEQKFKRIERARISDESDQMEPQWTVDTMTDFNDAESLEEKREIAEGEIKRAATIRKAISGEFNAHSNGDNSEREVEEGASLRGMVHFDESVKRLKRFLDKYHKIEREE